VTNEQSGEHNYDGDDLVLGSDGLPVRKVGPWSQDKHHFLKNYMAAFTTAMKRKWGGLSYVDLFVGPGLCRIRGTSKEIDAPPLLALEAPKPFDALYFVDKSADAIHALESRLRGHGSDIPAHTYVGDCNVEVDRLERDLSADHLHLAFIDPTGLHVWYDTLRKLTRRRKVDLIISLMDRLDLTRNIRDYYYPNQDSNLDRFLGMGAQWRYEFDSLPNQDAEHVSNWFLNLYQRRLRKIGYCHFGQPRRISGSGPFYLLFFASKHPLGAKLWDETSGTDRGGQRSFHW